MSSFALTSPLLIFVAQVLLIAGSAPYYAVAPSFLSIPTACICAGLLLHLIWAYSARNIARGAGGSDCELLWFILPVALVALALYTDTLDVAWSDQLRSALLLAGVILFLAMIWISARAVTIAEFGDASRGVIGTFLLTLYLFVGVWWLQPRLRTLAARVSPLVPAPR